jgi:hypothetical protein
MQEGGGHCKMFAYLIDSAKSLASFKYSSNRYGLPCVPRKLHCCLGGGWIVKRCD